ncbi:MAG: CoA transferase [Gammaproteobacteria bacterium]|nr:CoA transferase [Gammaproteobacteria bacterium]
MSDSAPLAGIRVLDLSRVLAGPWVGQTLADLGADVIKVERPGSGDDTRAWGPPFFESPEGDSRSAYFLAANRGKRSICVNLAHPEGQALVRRLAAGVDILVENYKAGDMDKRGLGYAELSEENPGLIYCSITGFGQTGPLRDKPGYDFMIQGMAGLMSITGERPSTGGASDGGPQKVGVALADVLTGLYSTIAILAALNERQGSGRGQAIDMSLLDVQVAALANQATNYLVSGVAPGRLGNAHPNIVPYQTFATADGHVIVAVGNDAQFVRFCEAIGKPDLASDPRFADNASRVANRTTLVPLFEEPLASRGSAEWLAVFESNGVPAGPINRIDEVFAEPQVAARGLQREIDGVPGVANPIRYSRSELVYERPPPALGGQTREVLEATLGLDDAEIARLVDAGVIA